MKKIFFIFLLSFSFNLIWENLHFYLYAGYMGGTITEAILLRASVVDAIIITFLSFPFVFIAKLRNKNWIIIFIGIVVAILIELHALRTERWGYNEYMPIIEEKLSHLTREELIRHMVSVELGRFINFYKNLNQLLQLL